MVRRVSVGICYSILNRSTCQNTYRNDPNSANFKNVYIFSLYMTHIYSSSPQSSALIENYVKNKTGVIVFDEIGKVCIE